MAITDGCVDPGRSSCSNASVRAPVLLEEPAQCLGHTGPQALTFGTGEAKDLAGWAERHGELHAFIRAFAHADVAVGATEADVLEICRFHELAHEIRAGHRERARTTNVARLVYAAHLGLVDDAYRATEVVGLGPAGSIEDIMGPDGYRTAILFQANMPELRNDRRFPRLCARLGLVDFWLVTERWPDCASETPYDFKLECRRAADTKREPFAF